MIHFLYILFFILLLSIFLLFLSGKYPKIIFSIITPVLLILFLLFLYKFHAEPLGKQYSWKTLKQSYSSSLGLPPLGESNPSSTDPPLRERETPVVFLNSYSYSTFPTYGEYSTKIISKYCSLHNYTHIMKNHNTDSNQISPYWDRVRDLLILSQEYPDNTIFVYLDIDAVIVPRYFSRKIPTLLDSIDTIKKSPSDIYIGYDPPLLPAGVFNTGVMIVRNTPWSRNFLKIWYNTYDPSMWAKKDGRWHCIDPTKPEPNKGCTFAGHGYEQGELNTLYKQNNNDEKNHITGLHYTVISNQDIQTDSFVLHLMGASNKKREAIFKKFLTSLK